MHAAREEDAVAYMTQFDTVDMMGIEFPPYEEPPPPYTPPKPPEYTNGEAPPPPYTPENNNNEGEGRLPRRPGGYRGVRVYGHVYTCDFSCILRLLCDEMGIEPYWQICLKTITRAQKPAKHRKYKRGPTLLPCVLT